MKIFSDKNDPQNPNYLCMSPKSGNAAFSNSQSNLNADTKFQYPPASPTLLANLDNGEKLGRKKPGIPEEIPMLKNNGVNSDSESEATSPNDPKKLMKMKDLSDTIDSSLKATNNYVNVPTAINKPKDAFSNPGYVTIGMGGTINDR